MNRVYVASSTAGADGPTASVPLALLLDRCASAVAAVRAGRSLTPELAGLDPALRPAVQSLAFAVLRRLGAAQAARRQLAPKAPPPWVEALLLSAFALAWPLPAGATRPDARPYADHTLVDQAVAAVRKRVPSAGGFVNAVLRRFVRERDALAATLAAQDEVARYNHPAWWIARLRQDWPADWQALLEQAAQRPPMTLRVNRRRCSGAAYVERLAGAGLAARVLPVPLLGGQSVQLEMPVPVGALPGFDAGDVSVQDAAAQRAAPLLLGAGLAPGARVLDACAAPGGKTAHLLEWADLELTALDSDAQRLQRVQRTLERLHLKATLKAADARDTQRWWDGRPFDAILLDAPCSASGIVRRHPDVPWLRRPTDIDALARTQGQLLDALWPLLAPGGRLLYATCSVFRAEGMATIDAFLQRPASAGARHDGASPGHLLALPDNGAPPETAADGFFYALIHKA